MLTLVFILRGSPLVFETGVLRSPPTPPAPRAQPASIHIIKTHATDLKKKAPELKVCEINLQTITLFSIRTELFLHLNFPFSAKQ